MQVLSITTASGEGKCGGDKGADSGEGEEKDAEGKCGEGKCGGSV